MTITHYDSTFLMEWLHMMSQAIEQPQHPHLLYSVVSIRMHGKTVIGSTVIVEMQRAGTYKCVYCRYLQIPFQLIRSVMQPGVQ